MDIGATVHGYTADLTRTNWLGEPPAQLAEIYTIVQTAQDAALGGGPRWRSGKRSRCRRARCHHRDRVWRAVRSRFGSWDRCAHSRWSVLARPTSTTRSPAPESILTIEPGIYIRDFGGVRIEDVVLVTDEGYELLSHAPKRPQL